MHNSQNKKSLQIILVVLIAVLTLGIGYASISAINLIINGNATASVNQNNFRVYFVPTAETPSLTGNVQVAGDASISTEDNLVALFDVSGLSKEGDYAIATYTIINNSEAIGADITLKVTNSNGEYFKVTETITDSQLQAGDTTTGTIKVEMIKTPIVDNVTTSVTGTLTATPIEDAQAVVNNPASRASDDPVSFATDSWATIKTAVHNNNASAYHVGDTKTVTIGANNYTVRIANKSEDTTNCSNANYSQTACGFVVEFSDIITTMKMNENYTNVGGYPATLVFDYLNNTLLEQLPSDLQGIIEPTRVISGYGNSETVFSNFISTNQKLYLLSGVEVFGSDSYDTAARTTTQLEYYQNPSNSKIKQYNLSDSRWWLRTPSCANWYGDFRIVNNNGDLTIYMPNYSPSGVSPAFRIA